MGEPPSEKTKFTNAGMKCSTCCDWQKKIECYKNFNVSFIKGSTNYKQSSVTDHEKTDQHSKSKGFKDKKHAESEGIPLPHVSIPKGVPDSSALKQCFNRMGVEEKESVKKLFDLSYMLAKKGWPYYWSREGTQC